MPKLVYFDTSVWLAPYDKMTPPRQEQVPAISPLIDMHNSGEIQLITSQQVTNELQELSKRHDKVEKASKALEKITSLRLDRLPWTLAIWGRLIWGEMRWGQGPNFDDSELKEKDKAIAEFMTANNVDYFVSVDNDFLKRKPDIEARLQREHTTVFQPQELLKELREASLSMSGRLSD
jgi:predicted nucleic acid-binding protein